MMNATEFLDQKLGQLLKSDPSFLKFSGISGQKVLLDLSGPTGGCFLLDFDQDGLATFENKNSDDVDCRISMKEKVFMDLARGKVNVPMALLTRKIKVKGNLNLAGKVALILKDKLL